MATSAKDRLRRAGAGAGLGVDRYGGQVIDPSENVAKLNDASSKRQDDLRKADGKLYRAQMEGLAEIVELRAEHRKEVDAIRDKYEEQLRLAEAKRIDAIRAVDVNAVAVASQRAADQASVLASQVTTSADALRALVQTTQSTLATAQQQQATQFSDRLTKVEQAQYAGGGKAAGVGTVGALVVGAVVVVGTVVGIIGFFASSNGKATQAYVPPAGYVLTPAPPAPAPR